MGSTYAIIVNRKVKIFKRNRKYDVSIQPRYSHNTLFESKFHLKMKKNRGKAISNNRITKNKPYNTK